MVSGFNELSKLSNEEIIKLRVELSWMSKITMSPWQFWKRMGDKFHLQGHISRKELKRFPAPSICRTPFKVGLCHINWLCFRGNNFAHLVFRSHYLSYSNHSPTQNRWPNGVIQEGIMKGLLQRLGQDKGKQQGMVKSLALVTSWAPEAISFLRSKGAGNRLALEQGCQPRRGSKDRALVEKHGCCQPVVWWSGDWGNK